MDVDLVVNRDQEELDLEVVRLRAVRAGVRIRGALVLERVHLVKEEILELHHKDLVKEVLEQRTEVEQLPRQEVRLTHVVLELRTEDVQV